MSKKLSQAKDRDESIQIKGRVRLNVESVEVE